MKTLAIFLTLLSLVYLGAGERETAMEKVLRRSKQRRQTTEVCIGGNDCCRSYNRCGIGEGDCDGDEECMEYLHCGEKGNCNLFLSHLSDVHDYSVLAKSFSRTDRCCAPKDWQLEDYLRAAGKEVLERELKKEEVQKKELEELSRRARAIHG